jgi:hypothetical protein
MIEFAPGGACCLSNGSSLLHVQTDQYNHLIRRVIMSSGAVTTLAGVAGITGSTDGVGLAAMFNVPMGVALDAPGSVAIVVSVYWFWEGVRIQVVEFVYHSSDSPSRYSNLG